MAPGRLVRGADAVEINCAGGAPGERLLDLRDGFGVFARLVGHEPQQVIGLGVGRIAAQDFTVALCGLVDSAGLGLRWQPG